MRKTRIIIAAIMAWTAMATHAQNNNHGGKPIIEIFTNFHTGMYEYNDDRGFEMERSYLGYQYQINNELSIKSVFDVGMPKATANDYERLAYIKHAHIKWQRDNWTIHAGLIPTLLFNSQDKSWGYRYIMQSVQGEYKFGSSADLGVSAAYKITDWLEADAIIANGEGYKKIQQADGLLYGLGTTLKAPNGLMLRLYANINEAADNNGSNIVNYAMLAGYKTEKLWIGAEYTIAQNLKHIADNNKTGLSAYVSARVAENTNVFVRFDKLTSLNNLYNDNETGIIICSQFKIGKHIYLAPNFRLYFDDNTNETPNKYMFYLSSKFSL